MIKYAKQMRYYDYDIEKRTVKKNKKRKTEKYINNIMTLDIEVSSAWLENGKVIGYRKGADKENENYWNDLVPLCLPYIWQFSCDDNIYYGREFWDFEEVLDDLPKDCKIIIWVHNLSYEFHFLSNFLEWKEVFARSPHKPMKAVPKEFPNIEFRCSYMLTRLSLDAWGKQLGIFKKTGDLDYEKIRTPYTPLTDTELNYCEQDLRVLIAGIRYYVSKYGNQQNIPLTQTGTVRREVKARLISPTYIKKLKYLVPANADQYAMLREVFAGGYTHANRKYSGKVIKGLIEHYDFASSYPTVMIAEKYPMTAWAYTSMKKFPDDSTFDNMAYIIKVTFKNIECISYNTYIQQSKCEYQGARFDNGRVLYAKELTMLMTEQDYITIRNNYRWQSYEIHEIYESKKDYLPKAFIEYILELYKNKTELKDVEGMEDLYMQSKQYINSLFGMMVTAIIQADVVLNGDEWDVKQLTKEAVNSYLNKLFKTNKFQKRYFLSYSWGIYVTAYARRNLWTCIESCDKDLLYCDTDSIFVLGEHDFLWYDDSITNKLKIACEHYDIDFELTRPKAPNGKQKPLGIFTSEDRCTEFITLGAKRYCERRENDGELHLTVSGINKSAVALLENDISNFRDGFNFDKDADCVTKRLTTYVTNMPVTIWDDGYVSTYKKGINLRRNGYNLSMTDSYKELIDYCDMDVMELPEQYLISLRGSFTT